MVTNKRVKAKHPTDRAYKWSLGKLEVLKNFMEWCNNATPGEYKVTCSTTSFVVAREKSKSKKIEQWN